MFDVAVPKMATSSGLWSRGFVRSKNTLEHSSMMIRAMSYMLSLCVPSFFPKWSRIALWTAEGSGLLRPHLRGKLVTIVSAHR